MHYIVCKDDKGKRDVLSTILSINRFIYKDDNLENLYSRIQFLNYDNIDDEIIKMLEINTTEDKGDNVYYNFYSSDKETVAKLLIDMITFCRSGNDKSCFVHLFYHSFSQRLLDEYLGKEHERDFLDEIADFGLIAFSNRLDVRKSNILIHSFLYDRDSIPIYYDEVMGYNSFKDFNDIGEKLALDYRLHNQNVSDYEFNYIMSSLKDYFYKRLDTLSLLSTEKEQMIERFEEEYKKLISKQKTHQKK